MHQSITVVVQVEHRGVCGTLMVFFCCFSICLPLCLVHSLLASIDAVAAGTVGAWTSLATSDAANTSASSSTKTSTPASLLPPILPKESIELLEGLVEVVHKDWFCDCSPTLTTSRVYAHAAAAFAFGLACGSASCLQEENSVLDVRDVNRLFRSMIDDYSFDESSRSANMLD